MWQRLLDRVSKGETLQQSSHLAEYELYTYSVQNPLGLTWSAAILFGDGEIHIHEERRRSFSMLEGELRAVEGILGLLPGGKCVEMRHTDPQLQKFWNQPDDFFAEHPELQEVAERIGEHVQRGIRFEAPTNYEASTMRDAAQWLVGRALGT